MRLMEMGQEIFSPGEMLVVVTAGFFKYISLRAGGDLMFFLVIRNLGAEIYKPNNHLI